MKKITINFSDMWDGFDVENNIFLSLLSKEYEVEISVNPEYLIYSCFGYEFLKYNCIRIFFTGENIVPDFNLCDYAIGFSHLNFGDRYIRFPLYILFENDYSNAQIKHKISDQELKSKQLFCNYVYSNKRKADPYRDLFFDALSKYKKVDSGGGHLNNLGYRVKDKIEFQERYKFSIAFENSIVPGYTTEKIIHAFAAKTIPIYWGNPLIGLEFDTRSFVNCHEFSSTDEIIEKIIEIDQNEELFRKIMQMPIFKEENTPNELSSGYLLKFFRNIFEQDIGTAARRVKYGWSYKYEGNFVKIIKDKSSKKTLSKLIRLSLRLFRKK